MLNENEIKRIVKAKLKKDPIGCNYYKDWGFIFPLFEEPKDQRKIPTMGGGWYIDEKTKEMATMTLFDMLDYTGKIETYKF